MAIQHKPVQPLPHRRQRTGLDPRRCRAVMPTACAIPAISIGRNTGADCVGKPRSNRKAGDCRARHRKQVGFLCVLAANRSRRHLGLQKRIGSPCHRLQRFRLRGQEIFPLGMSTFAATSTTCACVLRFANSRPWTSSAPAVDEPQRCGRGGPVSSLRSAPRNGSGRVGEAARPPDREQSTDLAVGAS